MVRVAVVDSGVNSAHPHINGVAGGATIGETIDESSYTDVLGHGTAVMAAIKEKAPDAEYFAVRVFQDSLRTSIVQLVRSIEWCLDNRMDVINLSLGTANAAHASRFEPLIERAAKQNTILVAARDADGVPALPGSLSGVIGISLDWDCPRDAYYTRQTKTGIEFVTSGYPRSLPGVPPRRNLHGISFAVANMTGWVVNACRELPEVSLESVRAALAEKATSTPPVR